LGCQTKLCQYQTDRGDILPGRNRELSRGVWVVVLPGLDLDWGDFSRGLAVHPVATPQPRATIQMAKPI